MPRFTDEDDALLDALGVEVEPEKVVSRTARDERIIAGFEDIQRFVDENGHVPRPGEEKDIFERLYAVRLERIRQLPECRELVGPLDRQGLLKLGTSPQTGDVDGLDDAGLLEALGVGAEPTSVTTLKHVRSSAEKRAAEEVASSRRCEDFETFRPLFKVVEQEVKSGLRQAQPITASNRSIEAGDFFIVGGLTAYVADVGELVKSTAGEPDARLRVIYSNGTESNLLLRSLQRAFYEDPGSRRLASPDSGQLVFGEALEADDVPSGTIYVVRSLSDHPYVAQHRDMIHKIGVTGGSVETRIANAEKEATYLLAKVEVVATYKLAAINRTKLETLFHRIFSSARLNITIPDRFGNPFEPREWFLVPLACIDDAVKKLRDGTITDFQYDPSLAQLVRRS